MAGEEGLVLFPTPSNDVNDPLVRSCTSFVCELWREMTDKLQDMAEVAKVSKLRSYYGSLPSRIYTVSHSVFLSFVITCTVELGGNN